MPPRPARGSALYLAGHGWYEGKKGRRRRGALHPASLPSGLHCCLPVELFKYLLGSLLGALPLGSL